MIAAPFTVVTLMEILETSAEAWWRLSSLLGQTLIRMESPVIPDTGVLGATMGELQREAVRLNLQSAADQLDRIQEHIFGEGDVNNQTMRPLFLDLHYRVIDELKHRVFLTIPPENIGYYRPPDPLFGKDVEAKFPEMSEDISESGKCLALGRSTAAVFHLMRVMEISVQRFGSKLGIVLATEKNWQNILDEINKAIKAMNQKSLDTKAYAEASAHLYNVKLCWRNAVMHPKQTYTDDEARSLFLAVGTFIRDLSGIL